MDSSAIVKRVRRNRQTSSIESLTAEEEKRRHKNTTVLRVRLRQQPALPVTCRLSEDPWSRGKICADVAGSASSVGYASRSAAIATSRSRVARAVITGKERSQVPMSGANSRVKSLNAHCHHLAVQCREEKKRGVCCGVPRLPV